MREFHSHIYFRLGVVKAGILAIVILIPAMATATCRGRETDPITPTSHDATGPAFNRITTSSKGFSIECVPTSITVTADITDPSGIMRAVLWHRVGNDQSYTHVDMNRLSGNNYSATVKALDIPVGKHGVWEFYVAAEDSLGNRSQSAVDSSVQLLPCVSQ